jgi:hypothetical protein
VFDLARTIEVIEHDGTRHQVTAPNGLMDMWSRKNEEAVATGFLPDGMIHFDLLFRAAA